MLMLIKLVKHDDDVDDGEGDDDGDDDDEAEDDHDDDNDDDCGGSGRDDGSDGDGASADGGAASWYLSWRRSSLRSSLPFHLLRFYRGWVHQVLNPAAATGCSPSSVSKLCDCTVFNFAVFAARIAC